MQQKNEQSQRIPRPFNFLQENIGKKILIDLKEGNRTSGILQSFDLHTNIIITETQTKEEIFLRGDSIIKIRRCE